MITDKHYGTGRRKTSAARVFLTAGTGEINVNGSVATLLQTLDGQPHRFYRVTVR